MIVNSIRPSQAMGEVRTDGSLGLVDAIDKGPRVRALRAFEVGQRFRVAGIAHFGDGRVLYLLAIVEHPDGAEMFSCAWYEASYFAIVDGTVSDWVFQLAPSVHITSLLFPDRLVGLEALRTVQGFSYHSLSDSQKELFNLEPTNEKL